MADPQTDTVVACLTPPGRAAVAVLAVDGPHAWEVVRPLFRTRSGAEWPADVEAGRFGLGRLGGAVADEVVLTVRRTGPSQQVELHCHGGRANVRFLLELLAGRGLRVCDWREYLRRTEPDGLRAAAAVALAKAPTVRTAAVLLDQYQGAFAAALDAVLAALGRGDTDTAAAGLDALLRYAPLGGRLTRPWRVVVTGPPNVGKSSLVNALAGYQRSIVTPTPGTTRDVVTTRLAIDGWPVELADTAGLRETADALEAQGVRRAREAAGAADLCLRLVDASAPRPTPADGGTDGTTGADEKAVWVINKIDLPSACHADAVPDAVRVSARTGAGLAELCDAVGRRLVPDAPPAGAAVPFTPALAEGIAAARQSLLLGRTDEAASAVAALRAAAGAAP